MTRLFVAVETPPDIRARLGAWRQVLPDLNWTPPQNIHLTLRFIGEVADGEAAAIQGALRTVRGARLTVTLAGPGLFERKFQSVLWAGLVPSPALAGLKKTVDEALEEAGWPPEGGRFVPHITLARIKGVSESVRRFVRAAPEAGAQWPVESFTLFRSVLTSSGAVHSALERYPLSAGAG